MTDTSTDSDASTEDSEGITINADIEGLMLDGSAPEVGDHVEVKVGGSINKVVNGVATITVETVNGTPIPATPSVEAPAQNDNADLGKMAAMADSQGAY